MVQSSNPSWPRTEAGIIDWEAVFEDPRSGLIPLIREAHSAAALRKGTIVIIEKLHSRKDDSGVIEKFTAELNRMIPDDTKAENLPLVAKAVTAILRRIKEERIRKAERYERNKPDQENLGQSPARKERRTPGPAAKSEWISPKKPGPRRAVLVWWCLGAAAAGLVAYIVFASLAPNQEEPYLVLIKQMKSAARGALIETHILGGALRAGTTSGRPFVTAEAVPRHECLNVSWVLLNHGTMAINQLMSRRMSPRIIEDLCGRKGEKATLTWYPRKNKTGK